MASETDDATAGEADGDGFDGPTRRQALGASAATWATVSLAGCSLFGGGETDTPTPTDGATPTATPTDGPTPTETDTPEPQPANYVVTDDMATGSEGIPASAGFVSSCSPTRTFVPGMMALWYVGIYDPETGEQLTDEDLSSVQVNVQDGPTVDLGWAGDDEENPAQEWGGSWVIPEETEPGTYAYEVEVTDGDANFRNVGILESSFTVIDYSTPANYVISNYTYAISSPETSNGFVSACGPEWQYAPGMTVAFAANIYDPRDGTEPGPDVIDSVTVTFQNGQFSSFDLAWQGDAEENAADVWESTLDIPEDPPTTGEVNYQIEVQSQAEGVIDTMPDTDYFTIIEP